MYENYENNRRKYEHVRKLRKRISYFRVFSYFRRWSGSGGFSLMETLIAASVLIIAVTGTLSIISRNVSSAAIAKDRVVAFYLAQEAIEYVRGVRDNNAIANRYWLYVLDACREETSGSPCMIDVNSSIISSCDGSFSDPDCDPLLLREDGVYGYSNGVTTIFTREVHIEDVASDREARVNVTVRWLQGAVPRDFTLSGTIFNWR